MVVARDATIRVDVALSDASCTRSRLPAIADVVQTPREARSTCVFYLIAFYPIRVNLCTCVVHACFSSRFCSRAARLLATQRDAILLIASRSLRAASIAPIRPAPYNATVRLPASHHFASAGDSHGVRERAFARPFLLIKCTFTCGVSYYPPVYTFTRI